MNPSRPFILRPVATTLLMVGVILVGLVAYRQLPVSALPQVDYPTIQVQTFYPGASPDVMSSSVTAPLERNFVQIPGLLQMTSTSSFGSSVITLQFNLDLNIDVAKGTFDGQHQAFTIGANDQLLSSDGYNSIIVAFRNGAPVRLTDVATAIDSAENEKQAAWANKQPAVILNIQRQPGANIISVVDRVKKILPQLQAALPASVHVEILTDRTSTIRASVADVQYTLLLTIALVVMVIFLFLRSLRATVIPSIAVPLSIVGTFGVMYLLGYSLNNLSLMALTISTGFVVDDAIVMIENISRYLEHGDSPLQAALKGSEQIGFTIVSLTVSLIAVLIPLLFMGDIVGRLFREFPVTLAVTILCSALGSLTLTPIICSKILRHQKETEKSWFYRASENSLNWIIDRYSMILRFVLQHQPATLVVTFGTLALTIFLFLVIPKGFFPVQDTGVILGVSKSPATLSFPALAERQQALAKTILQDPDVVSLSSFNGIDGSNMLPNSGRVQVNLKPREERTDDAPTILRPLQTRRCDVTGLTLYVHPV